LNPHYGHFPEKLQQQAAADPSNTPSVFFKRLWKDYPNADKEWLYKVFPETVTEAHCF